ncbi:MAG TPA: hypothetical protein PKI15_01045 [Candidatus Cloacimonadota bacterium]|nr:hypothetical protein [Candidatus Cloacimonadota bacterium]
MKTFNDIMQYLKPFEDKLIQVASYSDVLGSQKCVIIFEAIPQNYLELFKPLSRHLRLKRMPLPLVIDRMFIKTSLDSYPLEFIDMGSLYHNHFCREDIISSMSYEPNDVRLQIERELKSKMLHTRMAALQSSGHKAIITRILKQSILAIMPALKGYLFLTGRGIPNELSEILTAMESATMLKLGLLNDLIQKKRSEEADVYAYLELLDKLQNLVDGMGNAQK